MKGVFNYLRCVLTAVLEKDWVVQ